MVLFCPGGFFCPGTWAHLRALKVSWEAVPPNHPLKNRVFHFFHHPFWGPTPNLWKHPDLSDFIYFHAHVGLLLIWSSDYINNLLSSEERYFILWNWFTPAIPLLHHLTVCPGTGRRSVTAADTCGTLGGPGALLGAPLDGRKGLAKWGWYRCTGVVQGLLQNGPYQLYVGF